MAEEHCDNRKNGQITEIGQGPTSCKILACHHVSLSYLVTTFIAIQTLKLVMLGTLKS